MESFLSTRNSGKARQSTHAFLFPWAVSLDFTRWTGWFAMIVFLVELGLGLAYAWKKGALEWE